MNAAFKRAVNSLFDTFSQKAFYVSKRGTRARVQVILKAPDRRVDFRDVHIHTPTHMIEVRTSQISQPEDGDIFLLDGRRYRVQGESMRDVHRLVWKIEVVPSRRK
jgi:hypothetical protein